LIQVNHRNAFHKTQCDGCAVDLCQSAMAGEMHYHASNPIRRARVMPYNQVLFRSATREKILRGAAQLADAVPVTLGPCSKAVLIRKKWGAPIVCDDGVTIAKEFEPNHPEDNLGAQMMRQAAERTGDVVGDANSTAAILAHAIFADGVRSVVALASAIDLKRGLDRATKAAIDSLRKMPRPVATRKEKAQVVPISAHNDPTIGEPVADAMEKVGADGMIRVGAPAEAESKAEKETLDDASARPGRTSRKGSSPIAGWDCSAASGPSHGRKRIAKAMKERGFRC